jgi:hypothetical protein
MARNRIKSYRTRQQPVLAFYAFVPYADCNGNQRLCVLHLCNDHVGQFQAVADFGVHHRRVLNFLTVQPDRRNYGSRD